MRKFLVLFLAAMMFLCLCGCNGDTPDNADDANNGDSVLSEEEQRQLYYDAVEKTCSMSYLRYDAFISEVMGYPDEQTSSTKTAQVKMIDAGADDARYYASYSDGDKSFDYFYANEYIYSDESGEMYKAPITENEFGDYMAEHMVLAVGDEFADVTASRNDDGTYTVSLSGMINIPEALAKYFYKAGATGLSLKSVSGQALISDNGYLLDNSVAFELGMNINSEAVTAKYSAEISYENLGQRFTITLPDDQDCTEVEDIRAPLLIKNAYSNIYGRSYNASYESLYSYSGDGNEYSMKLGYSLSVSELMEGFNAADETVIDYDTVSSGRTIERSSQYENGVQTRVNRGSSSEEEMTDASARSAYHQMLLDYEPDLEVFKSITIRDMGSYYEIEYEYTDEGTILYCQNVLTALVADQEGIAVHSEEYTIEGSGGTIKIDKNLETLMSHEIDITAVFNDDDQEFTVVFEHALTVEML